MNHHRIALVTITAAVVLDAACGLAFAAAQHIPAWRGLYCALANGVTVGGDIPPSTPAGYAVTAIECLLIVPLFGATFSLFTSGLTGSRITASEKRVKAHVEDRLRHHLAPAARRAAKTAIPAPKEQT